MHFTLRVSAVVFLLVSFVSSQELTREQKLQKIRELNGQVKILEASVLLPDLKNSARAEKQGFNIFRIMPRESYDYKLTIQGGGSYYSFTTRSHDYQKIAQIGLEQNNLKVGFAGADYGFIVDLGELPLSDISRETPELAFLLTYKPPAVEADVRIEARKAHGFQLNGLDYKRSLPAVISHTYILRAISFDDADVLVALRIVQKDSDGSLIIDWKFIENFEKPTFVRHVSALK